MNLKLTKYVFKKMAIITAIYVGGFIAVMTLLSIIFSVFNLTREGEPIATLQVALLSNTIFMLIIGIVMPLTMFRRFVECGITRRQYTLAFIIAGIGIAFCLILAVAVVSLFSEETEIAMLALVIARHISAFTLGVLVAAGYLTKRVIPAIATTAFGSLAFNLQSCIKIENDLIWFLLYLAGFAVCAFAAVKVTYNAPIKA